MAAPDLDPQTLARGFTSTWQRVVTDPRGFFAKMPEAGGLAEPLTFVAICAGLSGVGRLLVTLRLWAALGTAASVVLGAFIVASLLVLVAQHLFDGRAGFEPVFRVVAYGAAPVALSWVPGFGGIAVVYGWFLMVRGIERVQEFDATRAALTVLITVLAGGVAFASLAAGLILPALR